MMKPMNPNKKPLPKSQKLAKNILSKLLKLKDIHDQRKTPNQQLESSILAILNGYIEEFENESYRNSITLDDFIKVTPLVNIYEWETFDLLKIGEHLINGALIKVNNPENQKDQYYPINPKSLRSIIQRAVNGLEKTNYYTNDEISIIEKLAKLYQKFYNNISPILPIIKTWKTPTVEVSEIQLKLNKWEIRYMDDSINNFKYGVQDVRLDIKLIKVFFNDYSKPIDELFNHLNKHFEVFRWHQRITLDWLDVFLENYELVIGCFEKITKSREDKKNGK